MGAFESKLENNNKLYVNCSFKSLTEDEKKLVKDTYIKNTLNEISHFDLDQRNALKKYIKFQGYLDEITFHGGTIWLETSIEYKGIYWYEIIPEILKDAGNKHSYILIGQTVRFIRHPNEDENYAIEQKRLYKTIFPSLLN